MADEASTFNVARVRVVGEKWVVDCRQTSNITKCVRSVETHTTDTHTQHTRPGSWIGPKINLNVMEKPELIVIWIFRAENSTVSGRWHLVCSTCDINVHRFHETCNEAYIIYSMLCAALSYGYIKYHKYRKWKRKWWCMHSMGWDARARPANGHTLRHGCAMAGFSKYRAKRYPPHTQHTHTHIYTTPLCVAHPFSRHWCSRTILQWRVLKTGAASKITHTLYAALVPNFNLICVDIAARAEYTRYARIAPLQLHWGGRHVEMDYRKSCNLSRKILQMCKR